MRKMVIPIVLMTLVMMAVLAVSSEAAGEAPWWKEKKIRFMWGCWGLAGADKTVDWVGRPVPREVFRNVALSGATVYADTWIYNPAHARTAKEFGMRYFAPTHLAHMTDKPGGRTWINKDGVEVPKFPGTPGHLFRCPLDEFVYERWLVGDEKMAGIREGIIDGVTVDWESTEADICYCDDCFGKFLESQGTKIDLPEKSKRFAWVEERRLAQTYEENYHKRRVAMFAGIRKKMQGVNPNFLFASYNVLQPRLIDFMQAMNTPERPFIVLDARHYQNDDRKPWWESYSARLKQDGYIYIPGGWSNSLFGAQPSQVSAARWLYETSINEDGVWMWFEHQLTDDNLRAYSSADRDIRAATRRVGKFLFDGKRDLNFATVVEWTGRPDLEKAVVQRSYKLGNEYLAHLNNVNSDWPMRVRIRFPRLEDGKKWTVRDPMGDLYYTQDKKSAVWTTAQLKAGVVVAMEARSDLFLQVSPARGNPKVDASALIYSREIDDLPEHADADAKAVFPDPPTAGSPSGRLVYTATQQMPGLENPWYSGVGTISINSIFSVDGDGVGRTRLRQLQGHLWSPSHSPDGSKIVFVHYARGRRQIFVSNADGQSAVNISKNAFCDRSPVWSPDGAKIAFISDREGDWDIWTMSADGSNQRRLAGNPGLDRAPAWSPDGKRIAWESHTSGTPNIWVCDSDGRNSHPLIDPTKPLKFQSVMQSQPGVFQIEDAAGAKPVFADNTMYMWDPVWSPDGKRIAAGALHSMAGDTIAILESDGSGLVQLIYGIVGVANVTWSPDGKQLAGTLRTSPQESERSGIFIIKADGTENYRWLVDVSPTGPRLGGVGRVGSTTWYSSGSAQPRRVVKTFQSLTWSPDGKSLAFTSDMDPTGAFYVYTVNPEGGAPKRLDATLSAWPNEVAWRMR